MKENACVSLNSKSQKEWFLENQPAISHVECPKVENQGVMSRRWKFPLKYFLLKLTSNIPKIHLKD